MSTLASRLTSTRAGAILLGVLAAAIAAVLLIVYLTHYRSSVNSDSGDVQVLVAKRLIPAGTTGAEIGRKQLYSLSTVPRSSAIQGALADPSGLLGTAAASDIFPGAQLTSSNIAASGTGVPGTPGASGGLSTTLKSTQRAVAIQIDPLNGDLTNVQPGDHVDIYQELRGSSGIVIKLFRPDVPVLQVNLGGDATGTSLSGQVILAVPARDSADVLYAARHTTLSFALRPAKGSSSTPPAVANTKSMLEFSRTHG